MQLDLRGAGITMIAALGRGHERCSRKTLAMRKDDTMAAAADACLVL